MRPAVTNTTAPIQLALAMADGTRRWWLRRLGPIGRALVRHRELRVAAMFSTVIMTALLGTLSAPLVLLALGPMLWGVPHVLADIRYLVVRSGYGQRPILLWVGGAPLLWVAFGGDLWWGFVGAAAVALTARASLGRRLVLALLLLGCGAAFLQLGPLGDIVFGHVHNFAAVGLWWIWRSRRRRLHWLPIGLLAAAIVFLLGPYALHGVREFGALQWHPPGYGPTLELQRLAPGLAPEFGLRVVLLFCFMQSIHYAVWLHLLPDDGRERSTSTTFRASYEDLRRDVGTAAIVVATLLALGIASWALVDLSAAGPGYFRMVRFHGHLELMAAVLLVLEPRTQATECSTRS